MSAAAPIARPSLHQEVLRRLREMIVEGRWPPGERLPELAICAELGVSRTPLREALKVLAAEGLVDLLPARGAAVRPVSAAEAKDMLELMGRLEAYAGHLACTRADDAAIAAIAKLHRQMLGHYRARRRRDYFRANQAIHEAIVDAAGNAALTDLHRILAARLRRLRFAGSNTDAHWQAAVAEHEEMIAALTRRDGRALARVLQAHEDNTWTRIRTAIGTEGDGASGV